MDGRDEAAMLLEVLDSTPRADGRTEDAFADDSAASAWLAGHAMAAGANEVRELRDVRDRLQAVVRGQAPASALSDCLTGVRKLPVLDEGGLRWRLGGADGAPARLVLAWARIEREAPGRLRACENPDCRLFLLDRSRNNTGRWCSMGICGNRMKARRHRARAAGDGSAASGPTGGGASGGGSSGGELSDGPARSGRER
jgi:predicted RNA-binding Zn ribbon-like protein